MMKNIAISLLSVFIGFLIIEGLLRLLGYQPFMVHPIRVTYDPEVFIQPDLLLGYSNKPGKYRVHFRDRMVWSVENDPDGCRITEQNSRDPEFRKFPEVGIYGGSFAYGYNLDNENTMAWRIQKELPEMRVKNFACMGYGLGQVYLQIQQQIKKGTAPEYVIINYAYFQNRRIVLSRIRQKEIVPYQEPGSEEMIDRIKWPVFRLNDEGDLEYEYAPFRYEEWPLMRTSAVVHLLEQIWNRFDENSRHPDRVAEKMVLDINNQLEKAGSHLLIAGIHQDPNTRDFLDQCRQAGIPALDISTDTQDPQYSFLPWDNHPNALSNRIFAQKILEFLQKSTKNSR